MSTIRLVEGSASSGNFGHAGRPGEVGGSASGSRIDRLSIDPNPRSFSNLFDKSLGPTSAALAGNLGYPFTTEQATKTTMHETGGIRFIGPYLSSVDAIDRAHVPNDPEFAKAIETETARMSQIPGMPKISAILSYKLEHGTAAMTMLNPQTGPDRQVMLFSDIKISSYATDANRMRGITKDGYVDDKVSSAKIVSVPHDFLTPNNATGWFATKSTATIIVDHEFGHAWMNANEGSEKAWLDAGEKDKKTDNNTNARISVYGAASLTENFAESFTHYVNGGPVKTMGAAKTAYLDAHFKDHVQYTPIRRSLKESLGEAIVASKAKLTQQDAEFKSVLKRATRSHVFAIEADVLRYQRDLIFILDRRLNAIDNAKDDAGHLALILMSLAHDFERVGAKYLRTACDAGFKRLIDDLLARKILSKTYGVIRAPELIVQSVIAANSAYIRDSLTPDLHAKIHQSADGVTTAQKFKERIKLYGHYLWSAAEQSYSLGLDLYSAKVKTVKNLREGSASSGNHGHMGRPGQVGGSANSGGSDSVSGGVSGGVSVTHVPNEGVWHLAKLSPDKMHILTNVIVGGATITVLIAANRFLGTPDDIGISKIDFESMHKSPLYSKLQEEINHYTDQLKAIHSVVAPEYDRLYPNGQTLYRGIDEPYMNAIKQSFARGEDKIALRPIVSATSSIDITRDFGMGTHGGPHGSLRRINILQMDEVKSSRVIGAYNLDVTKDIYHAFSNEKETTVLGAKTWKITSVEENVKGSELWTIAKLVPNE